MGKNDAINSQTEPPSESTVNLAGFEAASRVNGPGLRSVIWTQGCPHHCPGCFNPQTWSFDREVPLVDVDELHRRVLEARTSHPIEGITLTGGEPFAQAPALTVLAARCRRNGLNVVTYTGYRLEALRSDGAPRGAGGLLDQVDLLIDGLFRQDLTDATLRWRGSSNQRLHFLTDRLSAYRSEDDDGGPAHGVEVTISGDTVQFTGFPPPALLKELRETGLKITRRSPLPLGGDHKEQQN